MGSRNPGLSYTVIVRMLGNSLMAIGKKCQNHVPRNSSVRFHSNLLSFVVCLARRRSPGSFPWTNPIVNQMPNERPTRNGLQASKIAQQGRTGEWRLQP